MNLKLGEKEISLRLIIKVLLLVALVGFFCPFVTVSCGSEEIAAVSGNDLVTAAYAEDAKELGAELTSDVGLIVTLVAGVVGLGCAFIKDSEISSVFSCGAAAIAALFMLFSRYYITTQIEPYIKVVDIKFVWGWYLVLLAYIVTAICAYRNYCAIRKL